jgi:hypothetical protein
MMTSANKLLLSSNRDGQDAIGAGFHVEVQAPNNRTARLFLMYQHFYISNAGACLSEN